jgi:hypothetical protein
VRIAAGGLVLAALLTAPTTAGERPEESWNRRIAETVALLKQGEAAKARKMIDAVLEEMAAGANPGTSAAKAIGMGLMLRAVAESALGEERLALWDWRVAQQLDPALESESFTEFGASGTLLDRHRLSRDPAPELPDPRAHVEAGGTPLSVRKRAHPSYPERIRARWQGAIQMSAIVGVDGLPTYPQLMTETAEAGMQLSVSDALRAFEFTPAMKGGAPVPSRYIFGFKATTR